MGYLLAYTRKPESRLYHAALAYSVHFAFSADGKRFEPFNRNYGVLFALGAVNGDNTIVAKALIRPRIARRKNGAYLIQAQQTDGDGREEPLYPQWETRDFITFRYLGAASAPAATPDDQPAAADIEGYASGGRLEIPDALGRAALLYWTPLQNIAERVPQRVTAKTAADVRAVRAVAVYSDGSTCERAVDWDVSCVDFSHPGEFSVAGTVRQLEPGFPIFREHGDPVFFPWRGMWHYIHTSDWNDDRGFVVRRAATVEALFSEAAEQSRILDVSERFVQTFWAPEFHEIGGGLYLLFAVSGAQWGPQCHVMKLKKNGDILCAEDWETPVRVCRRDGSPLAGEGAITLDMTHLRAGNRSYVVWSHREHIGTKLDSGSMLHIAQIDPENPARLMSDPVLLSRPLYGWENIDGTINNEGPHAFVRGGKVYLAFSGGSANKYSYAVGLFTADGNADLLNLANWTKRPAPVLSYVSVPGRLGPGHNSFFSYGGELYIAYHAEYNDTDSPRCAALHRVHFDAAGEPRFDLGPERDLDPTLREVTILVRVP